MLKAFAPPPSVLCKVRSRILNFHTAQPSSSLNLVNGPGIHALDSIALGFAYLELTGENNQMRNACGEILWPGDIANMGRHQVEADERTSSTVQLSKLNCDTRLGIMNSIELLGQEPVLVCDRWRKWILVFR